MLRLLPILGVISLVIGCATPKHTDTGKHRIDCSGTMYSWDDCYEDAQDACGKQGYVVLSQTADSGIAVGTTRLHRSSEGIRKMIIRCKSELSEAQLEQIRGAPSPAPTEGNPENDPRPPGEDVSVPPPPNH